MKRFFVYFFLYLFVFVFLESSIFVYLEDNKSFKKDEYISKDLKLFETQYQTILDGLYNNLKSAIIDRDEIFLTKDSKKIFDSLKNLNTTINLFDIYLEIQDSYKNSINGYLFQDSLILHKYTDALIEFEYTKEFQGFKYQFVIHNNIKIVFFVTFENIKESFKNIYRRDIALIFDESFNNIPKYQLFQKYYLDSKIFYDELSKHHFEHRAKQLISQNKEYGNFLILNEIENLTFLFLPIKNSQNRSIGYFLSKTQNRVISDLNYQFKVNFVISTLFVLIIILAFILMNRDRVKTLQQKRALEQRFKKSSEELRLLDDYKKAVDISNVVAKSDIDGVITYVNDKFTEVSGYSKEELLGQNFSILKDKETPIELFENLWNTILDKKIWRGIIKNRKKNGDFYVVDATIIPILDKNSQILEFMTIRTDITELIKKDEKIKNQTTDSLTNLPNRVKLVEDIESSNYPSIAIINVDSFAEINDLYGNEVGDLLLRELGSKLSRLAHNHGLRIYKLNADEFCAYLDRVCENCSEFFDGFIDDLILSLNKEPFIYKEQEIHFTVTIGIAQGKEKLLIRANKAYREAKHQKRNYLFYSEEIINTNPANNLKWLRELKFAFERDNIKAYFQPIINNETGRIEKYESLVRLIDSKNEVKSPFFFLEVAKKSKLYPKITQKMIELSIEMFRDKPYEFSINLSVEDILNIETIEYFKSKLQDRELAQRVVLEIVESEGIENFAQVSEFIAEMKEFGCKIAIDDFGTGYSNFQYLASLNVDLIKIDGSLIKNIDKDKTLEIVTKTIIDFARELNIKTVAEFVHSQSVFNKVKELKIDYSQGFFLGEPTDKI